MVALPSLKNKPRIFNFMPITKEGEFKGYKSVPGLHCNFLFKNLSAKSLIWSLVNVLPKRSVLLFHSEIPSPLSWNLVSPVQFVTVYLKVLLGSFLKYIML